MLTYVPQTQPAVTVKARGPLGGEDAEIGISLQLAMAKYKTLKTDLTHF